MTVFVPLTRDSKVCFDYELKGDPNDEKGVEEQLEALAQQPHTEAELELIRTARGAASLTILGTTSATAAASLQSP